MNKLKQNVGKQKSYDQENRQGKSFIPLFNLNKPKSIASLTLLLLITCFLGSQLTKLKFNYSLDSFFPEGDDELAYYEQFNEQFGQYNDFLFIAVKAKDPLATDFLIKLKKLKNTLSESPEIESISSPFDIKGVQINPLGINTFNLISEENPPTIEELKALNMYGNYFGRDDQSVLLFLRHCPFKDKTAADQYYLRLEQAFIKNGFDHFLISGKIQMQYDFTEKLETELGKLLITSLVVVLIVLIIIFRSLKGIAFSLIVLILTLVWTMGFMAWTGKAIDIMVVMIPPILLIVSLSDVIHFIHKFDELLAKKGSIAETIQETVRTIGKATLLTSVTTAIGFLGLMFLPIQPIRQFGLHTAVGVVFAFLVTFLCLPALIYFFPKKVEGPNRLKFKWEHLIEKVYALTIHFRRVILTVLLLITVVAILGICNLRLSTSLIVGLQKNEPELQKVAYFDRYYDGYKPFELGIELDSLTEIISSSSIEKMAAIEAFVVEYYGAKHIQSPLNIIKEINAGLHGGARKYFELPEAKDIEKIKRLYKSPRLKPQLSQVQTDDGRLIRMIGRTKDLGSAHYKSLNDSLSQFLDKKINDEGFNARLTGASYLIDKTDQYVVKSLLKGIGFALAAVSACMLLFFRSWKLAIIAIIPNILPIVILFGLMGIFGIDLNISTAIIFTVALGIAIDDSIHLIARYKLESQVANNATALKKAFIGAGKSIIATSIVIMLGFSVFLSSGFSAAYYLGFFIVLAALVALIFDLLLLPILLRAKKGQ